MCFANVRVRRASQTVATALRYNAGMSEFELIARYFTRPERPLSASVCIGIGDDCALLKPGSQLQAISTDMLVEGRHFFADADPRALGHKSLAVNLSDLAAMGARPLGFTLALALPEIAPHWLAQFSAGLFTLADAHDCALIGGDTTKGPRTICITVFGEVADTAALRRDAARIDDDIWISGALGDARLALAERRGELVLDSSSSSAAIRRMDWPEPRIVLGLGLAGIGHAAIDISDGLAGDLGHILTRSQVGATLWLDELPVGSALKGQSVARQRDYCLNGGDDYELCFTAAAARRADIIAAARDADTRVTRVGRIDRSPGLRLLDGAGQPVNLTLAPFDHFTSP